MVNRMRFKGSTSHFKRFKSKGNDNVSPYSPQAQKAIDEFFKESIKNDRKKGK